MKKMKNVNILFRSKTLFPRLPFLKKENERIMMMMKVTREKRRKKRKKRKKKKNVMRIDEGETQERKKMSERSTIKRYNINLRCLGTVKQRLTSTRISCDLLDEITVRESHGKRTRRKHQF